MVCLDVQGPYEVFYEQGSRGVKYVTADNGRMFFETVEYLIERRGCYVFWIRSGRGLRAAYVGMAAGSKGFGQEVFTVDKLHKYGQALNVWSHGTPVLVFIVAPPRVRSRSLIGEVERYLIRSAKRAWPDLLNKHHAGADNWDIAGVTTPHRGRRSEDEAALVQLLKLKD
jgi:hypothetical protein